MNTILLRIYFVGLIAFVPGENDRDMTVLLLDAREEYFVSDGHRVEPHKPLLLARAGRCEGECAADKEPIAEFLYRGLLRQGHGEPLDLLVEAIRNGGAWELSGSELTIVSGDPIPRGHRARFEVARSPQQSPAIRVPRTPEERQSFDWVAAMSHIAPDAGEIDPDVLSKPPRKGLIVARLTLSQGQIRTHRLLRVGDEAQRIRFMTLRGDVPESTYSQALADWIVVEIPIPGCRVRLADTRLADGAEQRVMYLAPIECKKGSSIEVAILNVPASSFQPPVSGPLAPHELIGHHFEMYYELAARRPPNRLRPVPYEALGPGVKWRPLHPKNEEPSDFLASIILPNSRGLASPPLCPVIRFSD